MKKDIRHPTDFPTAGLTSIELVKDKTPSIRVQFNHENYGVLMPDLSARSTAEALILLADHIMRLNNV